MMNFKKIITTFMIGTMCVGMVACSKDKGGATITPDNGTTVATTEGAVKADVSVKDLEAAVASALGDKYLPDSELETLELLDISADLYDEFIYKAPAASVNCDTLIIIKAANGKVDEVTNKVNQFRDNNVNDLMQYPSNLTKIQCSQVVVVGNYVMYVQLGADEGTEAVIAAGGSDLSDDAAAKIEMEAIDAQNNLAIETIKGLLK